MNFLDAILGNEAFVGDLSSYVDSIATAAALSGLSQTFLRLTTPGVPDLYQGCEFWDFSLVDPDNRRRVDFDARIAALAAEKSPAESLGEWRNGAVKQRLIARVLHHRAEWPALYASGDYVPLTISGSRGAHVVAFERRLENARLICIASRWAQSLAGGALSQPLIESATWDDTSVALDDGTFIDVLNGGELVATGGLMPVAAALSRFPVALLFRNG